MDLEATNYEELFVLVGLTWCSGSIDSGNGYVSDKTRRAALIDAPLQRSLFL